VAASKSLLVDTIGDIGFCSPDGALRVDDTETTQVEAVQATKASSVISQSWSTPITLCKYQLMRSGLDSTMAEIIKAPL